MPSSPLKKTPSKELTEKVAMKAAVSMLNGMDDTELACEPFVPLLELAGVMPPFSDATADIRSNMIAEAFNRFRSDLLPPERVAAALLRAAGLETPPTIDPVSKLTTKTKPSKKVTEKAATEAWRSALFAANEMIQMMRRTEISHEPFVPLLTLTGALVGEIAGEEPYESDNRMIDKTFARFASDPVLKEQLAAALLRATGLVAS